MTSRRQLIKAGGAASIVGLAGCSGGDGGDGADGGDGGDGSDGGGTTTTTSGDGGSTSNGDGEEEIVLGGTFGISGAVPDLAADGREGFEYGVEKLNEDGGIMGRPVRAVTTDNGSDPNKAITDFQRFIEEEGAVGVHGPILSNVSIALRRQAEERGVPFIPSVGASGALLTQDTRFTFRLGSHPAPNYAEATVDMMEETGGDQIGAIYADYAWGHSYRDHLRRHAPEGSLLEFTAPVGASDFTQYLRQMPQEVPVIAGVAHPVGIATMYEQMNELGMSTEVFPGGVEDPQQIYETHGDLAQDSYAVYTIYDWHSDAFAEFAAEFDADVGGVPRTHNVIGYMFTQVMAAAIEDAGTTDGEEVASSIRNLSMDTFYNGGTLQWTEWGELDGVPMTFGQYAGGDPDFGDLGVEFNFEPLYEFDVNTFRPWDV